MSFEYHKEIRELLEKSGHWKHWHEYTPAYKEKVYSKAEELIKAKVEGPGGHEPDGTGPHGRGEGPGDGKVDGTGIKKKKKEEDEEVEKSDVVTNIEKPLIDEKIKEFFMQNPEPSDAQVHALAEHIGIPYEQLEEKIFSKITKYLQEKQMEEKIKSFFLKKPNPTDSEMHEFAEKLEIPEDELEAKIYKMFNEAIVR